MIIVTGELRLAPASVEQLRPAMRTVITANRREDGCLLFAFGEDVLEPGVIRIVERWRDWDALAAHDRAPHVDAWRAELAKVGVLGRDLVAHEATNPRPI